MRKVGLMIGNGWANIVAAAILAFAIIWTGGFGGKNQLDEEELASLYARAVGDIRNDIVISCGCCDDKGPRRTESGSF
ncbi:MAG: hypothetical protein KDA46_13505 [Parvularculaceae bacterium]|nr:hypothetical protein [Parvularculaceae bacterium]